MNENELKVLIDKMKGGDRESFNQLFRRYYKPMTRFCVRFVADGDQAAEIVQDLFVKLWTNREKFSFTSSFESYMLRAVRNSAITYINKERAHTDVNTRIYTDESDANDHRRPCSPTIWKPPTKRSWPPCPKSVARCFWPAVSME